MKECPILVKTWKGLCQGDEEMHTYLQKCKGDACAAFDDGTCKMFGTYVIEKSKYKPPYYYEVNKSC